MPIILGASLESAPAERAIQRQRSPAALGLAASFSLPLKPFNCRELLTWSGGGSGVCSFPLFRSLISAHNGANVHRRNGHPDARPRRLCPACVSRLLPRGRSSVWLRRVHVAPSKPAAPWTPLTFWRRFTSCVTELARLARPRLRGEAANLVGGPEVCRRSGCRLQRELARLYRRIHQATCSSLTKYVYNT